jgi:acyl-CoA thioesterase FadM
MPLPLRRIVATVLTARRSPPTGRLRHRVWPSYVDINLHMNHASYLEVMELGRWHWCAERGVLIPWLRTGLRPVAVHQEISYRRELKPLQRFEVMTRLTGREGKAGTFTHQFMVGERVHAEGAVRFLLVRNRKVLDEGSVADLLDRLVDEPRARSRAAPSASRRAG